MTVTEYGPSGGTGGDLFWDVLPNPYFHNIQMLSIGSRTYVDSIEVHYIDGTIIRHGSDGGQTHLIIFGPDEYITRVYDSYTKYSIKRMSCGAACGRALS